MSVIMVLGVNICKGEGQALQLFEARAVRIASSNRHMPDKNKPAMAFRYHSGLFLLPSVDRRKKKKQRVRDTSAYAAEDGLCPANTSGVDVICCRSRVFGCHFFFFSPSYRVSVVAVVRLCPLSRVPFDVHWPEASA